MNTTFSHLPLYQALKSLGVEDDLAARASAAFPYIEDAVTKTDLERFATKEELLGELDRLPAKEEFFRELDRFVTKDDLFSTKSELLDKLQQFATKADLLEVRAELRAQFWRFLGLMVGQTVVILGAVRLMMV